MLAVARALERGALGGPAAAFLAAAWAPLAGWSVVRHLALPAAARVVAVGGATLGGSGKTPLAIACAAEIAAAGATVAFVGHAYRATPARPRIVGPNDDLREVGDEALLAARALAPAGVSVVVAPRRADAIAFAARRARVLVIDGVAQTRPVRASLALLAVDAAEPWGRAGAVPPRGDLRAPRVALLAACDQVVTVGEEAGADARVVSRGAWLGGALLGWGCLSRLRLGLLAALARPDRIVRSLARRGLSITAVVRARDHAPFGRRSLDACAAQAVDLWIASPKCALQLRDFAGVPFATLDHGLVLSEALRARCLELALPSTP